MTKPIKKAVPLDLITKERKAWDALSAKIDEYLACLKTGDKIRITDAGVKMIDNLRKYKLLHSRRMEAYNFK